MAFEVSQWPYSPDPRSPAFNLPGWAHSQVPPWSWILSTTNATGLYAIFNAGVVLKPVILLPADTTFEDDGSLPGDVTVLMSSKGVQAPVGPPPGITKSIGFIISVLGVETFAGGAEKLWPTAIAVWSGFVMVETIPSAGTIPDSMKITPAIWSI